MSRELGCERRVELSGLKLSEPRSALKPRPLLCRNPLAAFMHRVIPGVLSKIDNHTFLALTVLTLAAAYFWRHCISYSTKITQI